MFRIDTEFRKKILKEIPEIKHCFQCGTCVSSCLAARYLGDFNPRIKILSALYGQKDMLNDILFKCSTCNNCNERCPQKVNPFEALVKMKNIAFQLGLLSAEKAGIFNAVANSGFAFEITSFTDRLREQLNLPKIEKTDALKGLVGKNER